MKNPDSGHILHNIQHLALPFVISSMFIFIKPNLDLYDSITVALFGGLVPDVDHINIWLEYKFTSFRSFLKFVTKARRHRFSFLIFHNLGFMTALLLLIPLIDIVSPLGAIFLVAFLGHLCLDFFDDKLSIGRVTHWRYRRKT